MLQAQQSEPAGPKQTESADEVRLFRISENERYGFIDHTGKVVIAPTFSYVWPFSDGLARVEVMDDFGNELQGFVDSSGHVVIGPGSPPGVQLDGSACKYFDFQEGLAGFRLLNADGLRGFVDKRGQVVIPPRFQFSSDFSEGLAGVAIPRQDFRGPTYFIDRTGKAVMARMDGRRCVSGFVNGLSAICELSRDKVGFIDRKGQVAIPFRYDEVFDFAEERACVIDKSEQPWKYGFIDNLGNTVIPIELEHASSRFVNGLACAIKNKSTCIIDRSGKVLRKVNLDVEFVSEFVDGIALVGLSGDGACGFINENGEPIIPLQYDRADSFHLGLARVRKGAVTGYINRENQFVWKTTAWANW